MNKLALIWHEFFTTLIVKKFVHLKMCCASILLLFRPTFFISQQHIIFIYLKNALANVNLNALNEYVYNLLRANLLNAYAYKQISYTDENVSLKFHYNTKLNFIKNNR